VSCCGRAAAADLERFRVYVCKLCFADGIAYLECKTADAETVRGAPAAVSSAYWDTREVSNVQRAFNQVLIRREGMACVAMVSWGALQPTEPPNTL
jgi:hypothetical protein